MANTRGIRAGRAFVELGVSDKLSAGLRRAQRRLEAFGASVQRLGLRLASIAAVAFAPLGIAAVKAASDAEESLSRFAQVFGREADAAGKFADDLARRVGRSGLAARDALGTFQSFFTGLGFAGRHVMVSSEESEHIILMSRPGGRVESWGGTKD